MARWSFTEHPASVGETYTEHLRSACSFSASMISGGVACLIHAIFPFLFMTTASSTVRELHNRMVTNRSRIAVSSSQRPEMPPAQASPEDKDAGKTASSSSRRGNG